jgi:hypothetical protein
LLCAFTVALMGLPLVVSPPPAAADTGPVLSFPSGTTSLCDFLKAAPSNSKVQIADGTDADRP